MELDTNAWAGLAAGVAAMVPGSIIYAPKVLGAKWMKEVGLTKKDVEKGNPGQSMFLMLLTALVSAQILTAIIYSLGASNINDALTIAVLVSWLPISVNVSQVFFEKRTWTLTGINVLNHFLTYIVMGIVIGLFL